MGDAPASRARRRPGDRAARRARSRAGRRGGHRLVHRQLPAAGLGRGRVRRGLPVGGRAASSRAGCRWCRVHRAAGRRAERLRGRRTSDGVTPRAADHLSRTAGSPGCACTARPCPTRGCWTATLDLAALENGGAVVGCSDMFYGSPTNLVAPGLAAQHGRRAGRPPAAATTATTGSPCAWRPAARCALAELDTSYYVGNAPAGRRCAAAEPDTDPTEPQDADWFELLPRTRLQPDTRHRLRVADRPGRSPTSGWTSSRTAAWPGCGCGAC